MFASLFVSAFLATVMAQSSTDNSPLTTITLAASAIIAPSTTSSSSSPVIVTVTNVPVTTITLASSRVATATTSAQSQATVLLTSTITSTLCGSCAPTGAVTVAPVATTIRSSSIVYSTRNATTSGIPYGGNAAFPVNQATALANGTVSYNAASKLPGAGSLAISAGVLAASYFAFVL